MTIGEADALFAGGARKEAVEALLADRKTKRAVLTGLAGSAPAMPGAHSSLRS